jgi:hypothetical protein
MKNIIIVISFMFLSINTYASIGAGECDSCNIQELKDKAYSIWQSEGAYDTSLADMLAGDHIVWSYLTSLIPNFQK